MTFTIEPAGGGQKLTIGPPGVGQKLTIGPPGEARAGWARSYLADGRLVQWQPPDRGRWAIDAELAEQPVPVALARRTGVDDPGRFWRLWTLMETTCKLLDEPALLRLRSCGLSPEPPAGIVTSTFAWRDVIVTVGRVA